MSMSCFWDKIFIFYLNYTLLVLVVKPLFFKSTFILLECFYRRSCEYWAASASRRRESWLKGTRRDGGRAWGLRLWRGRCLLLRWVAAPQQQTAEAGGRGIILILSSFYSNLLVEISFCKNNRRFGFSPREGRHVGWLTPKKFGAAVSGISGLHFWSPLLFCG